MWELAADITRQGLYITLAILAWVAPRMVLSPPKGHVLIAIGLSLIVLENVGHALNDLANAIPRFPVLLVGILGVSFIIAGGVRGMLAFIHVEAVAERFLEDFNLKRDPDE